MGVVVIAVYRAKTNQEAALLDLVKRHVPILREQRLVTDRPAILMKSEDGAILEVFEWLSAESSTAAHKNPVVDALWTEFAELCDFETLSSIKGVDKLFASFEALN